MSTVSSRTGMATAIETLLGQCPHDPHSPHAEEVRQAVYLARHLQQQASTLQTPAERRQQGELDRMIQSPLDKSTLMQLTDQAFRSRLPHRAADQLIHILDVQGVPRFFSTIDRTLLKGFQSFGAYLPGVAMPFVKEKMQQETANVVLPVESELLKDHLFRRRDEGLRMNVNFLGEALLGERESQRRLESYLDALSRPEIEVISVKVSTIYSQISAIAREHTVGVLCDRMELLYRAAAKNRFVDIAGVEHAKFVYLDMEEYRDLEITSEVFMRTLDRPGLEDVRAGIALQAYVPDSFMVQQRITDWAQRRVRAGNAPVTIRLVKGANLEMERVEASLHGWPQAPYQQKIETDANYKRMLRYGMQPEKLAAVQLGVASHNLFSMAYGLVLAARAKALDRVQFEMLEGMANHQRRALFQFAKNMLLYAPACKQDEFINAIGYLVRRLDENTGEENFLRHAFSVAVDTPEWRTLEQAFLDSFGVLDTATSHPRRTQDRSQTQPAVSIDYIDRTFVNEPDTDWALSHNGGWAQSIVDSWRPRCGDQSAEVPLVLGGEEIADRRERRDSIDPSRPEQVVARFVLADEKDVDTVVRCARDDSDGWRYLPVERRRDILFAAAENLSASRGELMGAMLAEGGKLLGESDPEVSEAIDFCRFYAQAAATIDRLPGLQTQGKGVVVVVSPWNFPLAIPCGGVAAALAAGNTVVLKPASDTVLIAYMLCCNFWEAGVPKTALQFMPCSGATVGQQLVTHEGVNAVILTGGTATAWTMLRAKPTLNLFAETGGKNATIVTALADRDLAIKNVLHSAFGHSGQKCSATSLLILEEEVYNDEKFRETLCDAIESMHVGSAWDLHTKIGPLINPPRGDLERGLKELETDESWAVMPRLHVDGNQHLVSPGVKWGVQPSSVTHCTEFFGPLLGVMCAKDLHEAIDLVNATGFGLTSGIESLDDREIQLWQEGICAGNLYVNRPTTGAIVLRQPFGGMGKSAVGPGIKAGGPNYVVPLMRFDGADSDAKQNQSARLNPDDTRLDEFCHLLKNRFAAEGLEDDIDRIVTAIQSCEHWMTNEFSQQHDHFRLVGEDNYRRYLPQREVRVRVHAADDAFELFVRAIAARTAGCRTIVSSPVDFDSPLVNLLEELTTDWAGAIEFIEESDEQISSLLQNRLVERLRYAKPQRVPSSIRSAAASEGHYVADAPVCGHARVELLWYFQEQSLSQVYHRCGNLGIRSDELRSPVL
ncbi:MAG: proline dehydrogenase family protein [Planctomycetota bacterium]